MTKNSHTILVVDDTRTSRVNLELRLQRQGYHVISAGSGAEALALLEQHPTDLVLLDLIMPDMDGHEVLIKIKADKRTSHIPVIMVSGEEDYNGVKDCLRSGAQDYLFKPVHPEFLFAKIKTCLV